MRVNNFLKCMMITLFIGIGTVPMMAQKNIDKIIQELEKRSDVSINSVTKRDPKTRKIVSMVKTFTLKDPTSRFIRAFEKDEEDAITAIKNLPKGRLNTKDAQLTFIFHPTKDEKRTYSLTTDRNGVVTLSVVIKLGKNYGYIDTSDFSFNFDFDEEKLEGVKQSVSHLLQNLKTKDISQLSLSSEGVEIICDELGCNL